MGYLEGITEIPRTDINSDSSHEERYSARRNSAKRKRSKKRLESSGSQSPFQPSSSAEVLEQSQNENENGEQQADRRFPSRPTRASLIPSSSTKQDTMAIQEDHRARFYEDYHKVSEEYDKEFLKKHDGDLNTTLIFAGLISAVTSAFIISVDSQLQQDFSDETAALLRVLIYKTDNTMFGGKAPTLPQWTGPPQMIVQVQAILFASLAASLFSAFLAMLGKQWLNRYESTDMRGSAVERSQNRQQKLGGIVAWYFHHVMESLPLMLQASLLLLGCALSRYLWEANTVVASVVLSVTSFGVIFYLFILIAGTAFESCPYQTPAAHFLRRFLYHSHQNLLPAIRSASTAIHIGVLSNFSRLYLTFWCYRGWCDWWSNMRQPWYSMRNIGNLFLIPIILVISPVHDAYLIGRAVTISLVEFGRRVYHRLMGSHRTTYRWYTDIFSLRTPDVDQQIMMDLRCISWILQTSLDKAVHLSAFEHLTSMPELANFHPALVFDCFHIFVRCISVNNDKVVVMQGLDQLAAASAKAFFRTLRHLIITNPYSKILADLQRNYCKVFPSELDFTSLPFYSTMAEIHTLAGRFGNPRDIRWQNYRMSVQEHIPFARHMVQAAQKEYQQSQDKKVPRWILRSALHFLSLSPVSPPSVIADCLTIIAIDLGFEVPETTGLDESARVEYVSTLIVHELKTMGDEKPNLIFSKRKAINTMFPYAIFLEQNGNRQMIDAILHAASISDSDFDNLGKFMWHHVVLYNSRLFEKQSPTSLNRVIALISPYMPWETTLNNKIAVARWAAAASAIPYTPGVGQNVVNALLQIASIDFLRPHIPIEIWEGLKRRPSLPPIYCGMRWAGDTNVIAHVRRLGDIDILKSYFLLIWAEKCHFNSDFVSEMQDSIKADFGGSGMEHHRRDLIERLDHVITLLGPQESPEKEIYTKLRDVLWEVNK